MANVEIYHSTDGGEWAVYLEQILQAGPYEYTVYIQNVHELLASPPRDDSYVCILIISPSTYTFLSQQQTGRDIGDIWKRIFPRANASLIMFYGPDEADFVKDILSVSCPGYKDIHKYQIKDCDDNTCPVFGMIKDLYMEIFSLQEDSNDIYMIAPKPACDIHPSIVSTAGENVLVICGEAYNGIISIEIEDYDEIKDVIKLNPYTYTFTMPNIVSYGTKYVTVCQDTHIGYDPVTRGTIEILSTADVVAGILKSCLTQSELLKQNNLAVSKPSSYTINTESKVIQQGNEHNVTHELYANSSSDNPSVVNSKTSHITKYGIKSSADTNPKASVILMQKDGVIADRPHCDGDGANNTNEATEESQLYVNFGTICSGGLDRASNIESSKNDGYNYRRRRSSEGSVLLGKVGNSEFFNTATEARDTVKHQASRRYGNVIGE